MTLFRNYRDLPPISRAICLGTFDGVHRGHQAVIRRALHEAKRRNIVSQIFTFDPHPRQFLGQSVENLLGVDDRVELLNKLSADELLLQEFSREFSTISAQTFVEDILIDTLKASCIVVGRRFHFGHHAQGSAKFLRQYADSFETIEVHGLSAEGQDISSSRIRELLRHGDITQATGLLAYAPFVTGVVEEGDARGRQLGFPTANLSFDSTTIASHMRRGVYVCVAFDCETGFFFPAVANFGRRPTFGEGRLLWEIHFLHFSDDLRRRKLRLFLLDFLRDEIAFETREQLQIQISQDCKRAEEVLVKRLAIFRSTAAESDSFEWPKSYSLENPISKWQSFQAFEF